MIMNRLSEFVLGSVTDFFESSADSQTAQTSGLWRSYLKKFPENPCRSPRLLRSLDSALAAKASDCPMPFGLILAVKILQFDKFRGILVGSAACVNSEKIRVYYIGTLWSCKIYEYTRLCPQHCRH